MVRRFLNGRRAVATTLLVMSTVTANAQSVPLNYNFNGLLQAAEWSGSWPGDPGVADVPNGYRSIADRALRVDGLSGAFGAVPLVGATGLTYSVVTGDHVLDLVMLGNRNLVDSGNYAFDPLPDNDNRGVQPAWLPNPDLTGPQTTTISPSILLSADSQIGVLYNISNGGGVFSIVLGFTDNPSVTLSLMGPDWFGDQTSWYASNSIPSPVPPYGGVASLSRLGLYNSVYWIDNPAQTGSTLNVTESVLTVTQLLMDGYGNLSGKHLSSLTFRNPSNASSYGIYAVSVGGGAPPPANDECASAFVVSEGMFTGTTGGATGTDFSSCGFGDDTKDVWYRYHASLTGSARISLCGSGFDTTLAIYGSCGGPELYCNDDYCLLQSELEIPTIAGTDYLVRIAGNFGATGSYLLIINNPSYLFYGPVVNPANGHTYYLLTPHTWLDAEAHAVSLGGHLVTISDYDEEIFVLDHVLKFDGTARMAWIGFTDQAEEGTWRWINNQAVTVTFWNNGEPNNAGGNENYAEMTDVGWWNDVANDNPNDHYGIVEVPTPPANDTCTSASAVTEGVYWGSADGATGNATSSCGGGNDRKDVWYDYTPSQSGSARVSLCGNIFAALYDTTLAIYSACGGGELVCNNDACGGQSQVEFAVVSGSHYYIRVAGVALATGDFRMTITNPPGVMCGPVVNPANGNEYYLLSEDSWTGAEARAQTLGGHLATINDAAENGWVLDNLLPCGESSAGWIGLHETGPGTDVWAWVSGQFANYTNWRAGEPNLLDTELDAEMLADGTWNNIPDAGYWFGGGEYAVVEIDGPGACCFADQQCTVLSPADCTGQGGLFAGGGTDCTPNPCLPGACCLSDGSCAVLTPVACLEGGGVFSGAPTCDPNPCPQPGACCIDSTCQMSPTIGPAWCSIQGGIYQGNNTTCASNPCPQDECVDADEIFSDNPVYGHNTFATGTDITSCADGGAGDWTDVWYKWTAPCSGDATFSLCDGTGYDSSLAIFDACGGAEVGCDDDGCGTVGGPSTVTAAVAQGATYYIRIAGYDGAVGDFRLRVTGPPCGGACCIAGTCSVMVQADCSAAGGVYKGDGVPCGADTCVCHGDLDCNGQVDFGDINPFVLYLSNFATWQATFDCNPLNGDMNGDGTYGQSSFGDINPFVDLLSSNPPPIPCE